MVHLQFCWMVSFHGRTSSRCSGCRWMSASGRCSKMCPAEGMCLAGCFLVAGVAVCLQDSVESLEEVFCVTAAAAGLVLVEADGMRLLVLAAAEAPHVGFRRILAALLFVDLHGRLICMDDILLKRVLLQSRDERHELDLLTFWCVRYIIKS